MNNFGNWIAGAILVGGALFFFLLAVNVKWLRRVLWFIIYAIAVCVVAAWGAELAAPLHHGGYTCCH